MTPPGDLLPFIDDTDLGHLRAASRTAYYLELRFTATRCGAPGPSWTDFEAGICYYMREPEPLPSRMTLARRTVATPSPS